MAELIQHSSESNEHYTPVDIVERCRRTMGDIDLDPASSALANETVQARDYWSDNGLQKLLTVITNSINLTSMGASRLFVNPPGGRLHPVTLEDAPKGTKGIKAADLLSSAAVWWNIIAALWQRDLIQQACFVCFSLSAFRTTQVETPNEMLAETDHAGLRWLPHATPIYAFPFVIPRDRINYDCVIDGKRVETKGAPADSAIVYLPDRREFTTGGYNPGASALRFKENFSDLGYVRE